MRVLLPAGAQDHSSMALGSFTRALNVAARINPSQAGGFVVSKPASSFRGAIMSPYKFGRKQIRSRSMHGLGETYTEGGEPLEVPESNQLPAPQPTPDPGFNWSGLATSLLNVGGDVTKTILQGRYAQSSGGGGAAPVVSVTQAPSTGVSTKTLVIAGAAVVGLVALLVMMRK